MHFFKKPLQFRVSLLIHCLIISGTLNIALITTFFITCFLNNRTRVMSPHSSNLPLKKITLTNQELLQKFRALSYEELVEKLFDESCLEGGQRRCDLALGCLVADHYFDIDRALLGYPADKRVYILDGGERVTFYPGLNGGKFEAIRTFAKTEVWPLTPEGLFREMQLRNTLPTSLKEAFESTNQYFIIQSAFRRLHYAISEDTLLNLLIEGEWEDVQALSDQIKTHPHGRIEDFPSFLVSRMERGSKQAARLLMSLEKEYALHKLSDKQIETLFSLLTESEARLESGIAKVESKLRSTDIDMQPLDPPIPIMPQRHIVQPGDTLWNISRRYSVSIQSIQEMNGLRSDCLKLGADLLIPSSINASINVDKPKS